MRQKHVRRGDKGAHPLGRESAQGIERLRHRGGAVVHAGDEVAVEVDKVRQG
jgi:hypothetical protein